MFSELSLATLLLSALATGLAGSAHCLGMCGGIGASLGLNATRKRYLISYHGGRLLSYTLLGLILGSVLPLLGINAALPEWGMIVRRLTAALIILIGLQMLLPRNPLRSLEQYGFALWRPISRLTRAFIPTRSHSDAFILGLCWGLLPCGLIYSALGLAIGSANPISAALVMFAFGVGTLPSMLSVTVFSGTIIKALTHETSKRALGVLVILLGLWSLWQTF
ncbi:sulfite exporter TauE/SafE family protein [Suttonella sp. R2A3]|uniref:sulfite exporter TauE/SafE family protein n=1 Tax=Suttonella sp. R2A3 TaxID=2908648 RepID=UPI001F241273|nr:sulfite exporter TauE/SafE family protein [Suttonella sp. R2A3]UJF23988.1 sulfite exporter TauE/SafE family protein [Suttonella sp. R2A3]